ncbi:MAG TPA: TolC family protein, partial [Vicinamibacterales bacterium]|nr:TolC family protein [Vicinamibacterales bacterium]
MARSRTIVVAAIAVAASALPARAQVSDARIHELIKQASERLSVQVGTQPPAAPAGDARPVVHLTLEDVVKLTLDRNLDIAVQRLNPEINDIAIASALSVYHPVASSIISANSTSTPAQTTISGAEAGAPTLGTRDTFNGGLSQSVPWGGGSFVVALNNNRATTTSLTQNFNPAYNANWSAVYTQPLMRNLAIDSNRRTIVVSKITRDISDVQLRATITNTVSNAREAYWNYVFAVQAVDVAQQSVNLAEQLVKDNQ